MANIAGALLGVLGPKGWLDGSDAASFSRDWLDRYGVPPLGVARPANTSEVAAVVRLCHEAGIAVVPQGGNTGLCGGAVAHRPGSVIVSLSRMGRIEPPSDSGASVLVEAGVVLEALHRSLQPRDLVFPMHLGAEGSARIGGLIGTNAGGSHAFRYGMMQDLVLGLEVVLPDGSVWDGLRAVQKDNAGYQLRRLFCGAEGTLGIVTRAVLRLHPRPRRRSTAFLMLPGHEAARTFATRLRAEAGEFLSGLEFLCDFGLGLALHHVPGLTFPLESRGPVYVLVELTSGSARLPLDEILEASLEWAMSEGVVGDGSIAMSDEQRSNFWRLREEQPEGQRLEGAQLKHDISVPSDAIPSFVAAATAECEAILPGVRLNPFGHLADGNIHCNLSPPVGDGDFGGRHEELGQALAALATGMGGSFAAEHGLGVAKIALADRNRSAVERRLMARLKAAFDPSDTMNPGVLLRSNGERRTFE